MTGGAGRERCACGKEIIATRQEARNAIKAFRTAYGAARASAHPCRLGHPWWHVSKGQRGRGKR